MENKQYKDNMNKTEQIIKRSVDFVIATCCLIFFSPLAIACAIAIRLEDGLPVIYRQERIGLHGKPFFIYKFRSMKIDAEKDGPDLLEIKGDPRLTKVGRFLRMHHLDELPQLWNVFKGDMAFVGPRPERKFYIDQIMEHDPRYTYLYQIRPGVTSYATLYNGYTDTMPKMLRRLSLDLYYLEHRSWWFDAKNYDEYHVWQNILMSSYLYYKGVNTLYLKYSPLYCIFFLTKSLSNCWEGSCQA